MDLVEQIKNNSDKIVLLFGSILVFSFGFLSGYFYLIDKNNENVKVVIEEPSDQCLSLIEASSVPSASAEGGAIIAQNSPGNSAVPENEGKGIFVASKNSKIFHKPDCSYAQKIKEENKVWFKSEEDAESKGYSPHSVCFK